MKLKLKVEGVPHKELESILQDLRCVGVTQLETKEVKDGIICIFDKEEWDGSKISTGCQIDREDNLMDDAKLLQQELEGISEPHWKKIKVTHANEV